jgi:basic membrane protein A
MRGAALAILFAVIVAGCGGQPSSTATTPRTNTTRDSSTGVVTLGDRLKRKTLDAADLVLVGRDARNVGAIARAHPSAHFVLVGRSYEGVHAPNVAGVLFRDDEAAYLAGVVAALVTAEEGALDAEVAWVGGARPALVRAFARGAHAVDRGVTVARTWSVPDPTLCKEAAITAIGRGAGVIFTGRGGCAEGALAAARDQNAVGLALGDFEQASVAVDRLVDDARNGLYHDGENVVFGAATGAVGIGRLDRRISPDVVAQARLTAQELASGRRSAG